MKAFLCIAFSALSFAACSSTITGPGGGGGHGSAAVSGNAGGQPVPAVDEIALVGTQPESSGSASYAAALITNKPGTCGLLMQSANPASATALSVVVATGSAGTAPPVAPGTYSITAMPVVGPDGNASQASATFTMADASCQTLNNEQATSGTVTITAVTGTTLSGTFDITFASGDHLSGDFSAPVCGVSLSSLNSMTAHPCSP